VDDEQAPYRGLTTFTESDADLFFGREREVEGFANRLRTMPFIAIVGPSGAGKSSFVKAGVLPSLGPGWESIVVRPGPTPLASLCARLGEHEIGLRPMQLFADPTMLTRTLQMHAARHSRGVLLVVDQFEELVTLCHD